MLLKVKKPDGTIEVLEVVEFSYTATLAPTMPIVGPPAPTPVPTPVPAPVPPPPATTPTTESWPTGFEPPVMPTLPRTTRVIRLSGGSYEIAESDVTIEIPSGVTINQLSMRPGTQRVRIFGTGNLGYLYMPHWDAPCSDVTVEGIRSVSPDTSFEIYGNRIALVNCTASAARYSIWGGENARVSHLTVRNCTFASAGPESTVRLTHVDHVAVVGCKFSNGNKHCLRFHGNSSQLLVSRCDLTGGNGLAIGSLQGVPAAITRAWLRDVTIRITNNDPFNPARDGSLTYLDAENVTGYYDPARLGWDPIADVIANHPSSWRLVNVRSRLP